MSTPDPLAHLTDLVTGLATQLHGMADVLAGTSRQLDQLLHKVDTVDADLATHRIEMADRLTLLRTEIVAHVSATMIAHAALEHAELHKVIEAQSATIAALSARVAALEARQM